MWTGTATNCFCLIFWEQTKTLFTGIWNEVERKLLKKALSKLSKREKTIIELRFGLNHPAGKEMTQKEVADLLGISQSYISRLEKKIIGRLKKEIVKYE